MAAQNSILASDLGSRGGKGTLGTDDELLASLGYKQGLSFGAEHTRLTPHEEFKRNFTPFEVFGIGFTIIGLVPSITYVSYCIVPQPERLTKYKCTKLCPRIFDTIRGSIGHGLGSK